MSCRPSNSLGIVKFEVPLDFYCKHLFSADLQISVSIDNQTLVAYEVR